MQYLIFANILYYFQPLKLTLYLSFLHLFICCGIYRNKNVDVTAQFFCVAEIFHM